MDELAAEFFDGRSARAHPVRLHCEDGRLHVRGGGVELAVPLRAVQWPERTRHGVRVAELPGGASLHCADAHAWDAFAQHCGRRDSLVVRAQQSWRWVLASLATLALLLGALYHWGVPWAAGAALALIPPSVDQNVGDAALGSLDEHLLKPSELPVEQRQALRTAFEQALAAQPTGTVPLHRLEFRRSRLGPNAFALPGGAIVLTDELVTLVDGDPAVITGVLGHELGHVRQRHGMRLLLQVSAIGVLSSAVLGDFSTLLAGVPVLVGQAAYTRDAEREADAESARILRDAGLSPAVMVTFFERIATWRKTRDAPASGASAPPAEPREAPSWLGIAIASHPADAERIRFFRDAASQR